MLSKTSSLQTTGGNISDSLFLQLMYHHVSFVYAQQQWPEKAQTEP